MKNGNVQSRTFHTIINPYIAAAVIARKNTAISVILRIAGGLRRCNLAVRCDEEQFGQVNVTWSKDKTLQEVNVLGLKNDAFKKFGMNERE